MGVPGDTTWPSSTDRMPTRPSNGARMIFLLMIAWRFTTVARVCLSRAWAVSRFLLGVDLLLAEGLVPLQGLLGQGGVGLRAGQLRLLAGDVEAHQHLCPSSPASRSRS